MKFLYNLLNYIFPLSCIFCERIDILSTKIGICRKCYDKETLIDTTTCEVCKNPIIEKECYFCNSRNIFFEKLFYLRLKSNLEKEIIQKIKFHHEPHLSYFFRMGIKKELVKLKDYSFRGISVVPSHKSTIRKRPIHPCKPVIESAVKFLNTPIIEPIIKSSNELQSGKSYRNRFIHAAQAFRVKKEFANKLSGDYLLIDDVFTTGATLNEIAKLFLQNGASKVVILVMIKGL